MSTINIQALADALKISKSTVSKALKDSHEISAETKKKVLELAAKLNYTPNPYASSLRKKKSKTIAIVMPEIADSFFALAINGIQSVAEKKGYHVLIYLSHEKYSIEKNILDEIRNGRVDGLLISVSRETKNPDHILQLQSAGIPVVFFDRQMESIPTIKVITNDVESGYNAAKHLLAQGCKHPVFLSHSVSLSICKERAAGFRAALNENGFLNKDIMVLYDRNSEKSNESFITKLLTGTNRPDGIVASVEKIAIQTYVAAQKVSLRIAQDLKVIAFSNLETASILNPPLSTITQPAFEIGKTASTMLFKAVEKSNSHLPTDNIVIPSTLIARQSTLG
ncbi:MAG: LacI family DNA-binding transcriptional regulator [Chitinophagaceae bacterium]